MDAWSLQESNTRSIVLVQVLSPEGAKEVCIPLDLLILLHIKLGAVHKIVFIFADA